MGSFRNKQWSKLGKAALICLALFIPLIFVNDARKNLFDKAEARASRRNAKRSTDSVDYIQHEEPLRTERAEHETAFNGANRDTARQGEKDVGESTFTQKGESMTLGAHESVLSKSGASKAVPHDSVRDETNEQKPKRATSVMDSETSSEYAREAVATSTSTKDLDKQSDPTRDAMSPRTSSKGAKVDLSKDSSTMSTSSSRTVESCEDDDTALFQTDGTPCVDWKDVVNMQHMYTINANGVKYVVCVPPKNGSTYHLGLMFRVLGIPGYDSKQTVHFKMDVKERLYVSNYTETEIADLFRDDTVPRYAMIRNPVTRTLSGYINKYGRFVEEEKKPEAFQEWVRTSLKVENVRRMNQHFRPQMEFCAFRSHNLKSHFKFFRVEEPEKYVDFVYKIIPEKYLKDGWPLKYNNSFREFVLGPRERTHNTDEIFLDHVGSLEVFDMIVKYVQDDITYLGYEEDVRKLRRQLAARTASRR